MGTVSDHPGAADTLSAGLAALGLDLDPQTQTRLLTFLDLMHKWNRVDNLTRITDPLQMVISHLLDSLAVLSVVRGPRVLDVGTGAGLPGIPLALARPDWQLVLVDSNNKKIRFLNQVKIDLNLGNVETIHGRVEKIRAQAPFDTVISRAVGQITDIVAAAGPLCAPDGQMVFMKGQLPAAELEAADRAGIDYQSREISVPGLDAARHLIIVHRQGISGGEHEH